MDDNKAKNYNSGSIVWRKITWLCVCPCKEVGWAKCLLLSNILEICLHTFPHLGSMDVAQENFWNACIVMQIISCQENMTMISLCRNNLSYAHEAYLLRNRWGWWSLENLYNFNVQGKPLLRNHRTPMHGFIPIQGVLQFHWWLTITKLLPSNTKYRICQRLPWQLPYFQVSL